ncbi:MAG: hypothetical protein AB8B60_17725 [Sulfitobacter sp.]
MNTALAILAHALRMLVFEVSTTLRVLMPALALVMGCSLGIALLAPDTVAMMNTPPEEIVAPAPGSLLAFVVLGAVGLLGYALMAVLWHRHVLLNGAERTEALRPGGSVFFGYLWRAIVVGFVQLLASIPVVLAMGVLGAVFIGGAASGVATAAIGLVGGLVFVWLALRFSVVLPAAALGHIIPVRESWQLTSVVSTELWGVALLLTGLNMFIYALSEALLPAAGGVALLAQTAIFIVEGLVFVSVLTTLYGHLVEGRSLGQERGTE